MTERDEDNPDNPWRGSSLITDTKHMSDDGSTGGDDTYGSYDYWFAGDSTIGQQLSDDDFDYTYHYNRGYSYAYGGSDRSDTDDDEIYPELQHSLDGVSDNDDEATLSNSSP